MLRIPTISASLEYAADNRGFLSVALKDDVLENVALVIGATVGVIDLNLGVAIGCNHRLN
jgi:hypothetical protein